MPSLSGLHMSRTISMGHSSRASRSISTSSGRRFLANSLRDFTLSFSVLYASMSETSLGGNAAHFTSFVGQFRQELQDVIHNSDIGHLKYWSFGVFVDGDDERVSFYTGQVLERAADTTRQVNLGFHSFPRRSDLARLLHPFRVDDRPRATHRRAQRLGEFFGKNHVVFLLQASSDGDQDAVLRDIHIACLGNDGLEIPASCRQSSHGG